MEFYLYLIGNILIPFLAAWFAAWYGVKLATKKADASQREFLSQLDKTTQVLSTLARRSPGGEGYAAVKEAEQRLLKEKETNKNPQ